MLAIISDRIVDVEVSPQKASGDACRVRMGFEKLDRVDRGRKPYQSREGALRASSSQHGITNSSLLLRCSDMCSLGRGRVVDTPRNGYANPTPTVSQKASSRAVGGDQRSGLV
jgi:hypothetical protein